MTEEAEIDAKSVNPMVSNFISRLKSKEADAHEYEAKESRHWKMRSKVCRKISLRLKRTTTLSTIISSRKQKNAWIRISLKSQMQSILKEAKEEISRFKSAVASRRKTDKLNFESKVKDS